MTDDEEPEAIPFDADTLFLPTTERSIWQLPSLIRQSLALVWEAAPRQLLLTVGLQGVGAVAIFFELLVAKRLLTVLVDSKSSAAFSATLPLILILVIILAVAGMATVLRTEVQRLLSELVSWKALTKVIDAAASADLVSFENPAFHDRLQRSTLNASVRPLQMTTGVLTVGSATLAATAIGVALAIIDPLFLVLALIAVVPVTIITLRVGRALFHFAVAQTPTDRQRVYIESLLTEKDPAKEIRAYGLAQYLKARFDELYGARIAALRRLVRNRMWQGVTGSVLTAVISGGTLALLVLSVSSGRTSLAGVGTAAAALLLLGSQLQVLAAGFGQLYESGLFVRDFSDFTKLVPIANRFHGQADAPSAPGCIELKNLGFTYPSRNEPSLVDINLKIEPGQVVALVGENGSGKTTLAKILADLYPPTTGSMTWDGIDVATLDAEQVRSRIAVLFQDFVHYFFSARENIGLGRWEHLNSGRAVRDAAKEVGIDRALDALPEVMGVEMALVEDPPWSVEAMTPAGRVALGIA